MHVFHIVYVYQILHEMLAMHLLIDLTIISGAELIISSLLRARLTPGAWDFMSQNFQRHRATR